MTLHGPAAARRPHPFPAPLAPHRGAAALRRLALMALALMLTLALPARAQGGADLMSAFKLGAASKAGAASAASAAASEASAPVDPTLTRKAEQQTARDDQRILADIQARLARTPALREVKAEVQAGIASLDGAVHDTEARTLAAKLVGAVPGVIAVDNRIEVQTQLGLRLTETMQLARERIMRLVSAIPLLLLAAFIVLLANWLGRWLASHLYVLRLDSHNPYLGTLLRRTVRTGFVLAGVLVALDLLEATALVTAVLGSAGVMGIVLGFAFRDVAENYLSGILLSLRRPFEPGDHVRIDTYEGKVVSLSTRNTVLMTLDGNELRLPNATVFKAVLLNFSHNPRRRLTFQLGVGYGEDLRSAQDLGVATLTAMQGVLADPGPSASIDLVGDSSVTINYYAWVDQRETDFVKARSEAIRLVKAALEGAGMDLPEPIYRVQLAPAAGAHVPHSAEAPPAPAAPVEPRTVDPHALARQQADVSPNTELEAQIAQERARKAGQDMLQAPGGKAD